MNYITDIADAIQREVNPKYLPDQNTDSLFRIYAVLALAKGTGVTAEDVHNAWAAWISSTDPSHKSIQPFHALSLHVQNEDEPFVCAIRTVASRLPL